MAYTTIKKPSDYFNTKLYTGTGSSNAVTGVGFQPDLLWFKNRNSAINHMWFDSVRGIDKYLYGNLNEAEGTSSSVLTAIGSDGFTVGANDNVNGNGNGIVSWNWLAANGTSANTDGSISSTVSANTTSGFSIVSYTGNGTVNSTIGHGLGATPKFIIVKNLTTAQAWGTKSDSFVSASDPNVLYLNANSAQADDTNVWGTSAVFNNNTFTVGDWNGSNQSSSNFIAYCWSEVQGFSKFGSYIGNGNDDGTFIYTGFKPAWIMIKATGLTENWWIMDSKRSSFNIVQNLLQANSPNAELVGNVNFKFDMLSNGFKLRDVDGAYNNSGQNYIFMAFASEPLVGDNPATAR